VRILAIETSSQRGTVALVERLADDARVVLEHSYDAAAGHSTQAMRAVDAVMREAGWSPQSLDRVVAGVGPGSFTGLRVGISVAQGIALAIGKPVVGVGSLRAMCHGVPDSMPGIRCAFADARRGDWFAAAYDETGRELAGATVVPREGIAEWVRGVLVEAGSANAAPSAADAAGTEGAAEGAARPVVLVGAILGDGLDGLPPPYRSDATDAPHARCTALLGATLDPATAPAEPEYVRDADAIRPTLARHPVLSEELK
jgi:tRNA threonylcarbamoyladenosine biosynthesis protein TsaB